jgi:hypothetical protein
MASLRSGRGADARSALAVAAQVCGAQLRWGVRAVGRRPVRLLDAVELLERLAIPGTRLAARRDRDERGDDQRDPGPPSKPGRRSTTGPLPPARLAIALATNDSDCAVVATLGFRYPRKLASGIPQNAPIDTGHKPHICRCYLMLASIVEAVGDLGAYLLVTRKVLALQRVMGKLRTALASL